MKKIHVVHRRVGGVGHIASLLERSGDEIIPVGIAAVKARVLDNSVQKIFFHQPRSHLCCLLIALICFGRRQMLCCILHEASIYNLGATGKTRALLGALTRLVVVRLCVLLGVEIRAVSAYVARSYGLKFRAISYLYLFSPSLGRLSISASKTNCAVVWLRRGTAQKSFRCIEKLYGVGMVSQIVLLGDPVEITVMAREIRSCPGLAGLPLSAERSGMPEAEFLECLRDSRWFVSFFPREGFGLSVFQAAYFGCVVLGSWSGAIVEWLPSINCQITNRLLSKNPDIPLALQNEAAAINHKFAIECLR